ncbi:MAG: flagellin lysine-N-methylase, partial [Clostridia bacterium]|nr:flagellin lysine-N-methylase [Clostridia bacterium]
MKMEYPDYYERFACIGPACTDSCCARWEIDVDEESYYRYLTVQGPFGDRIRGCLHEEVTEGEDGPETAWSFPLTEDRRCPFLNDEDLCDMYTELGHDKLPRTCREFPRGDAVVGNYHQIDVALACPEANRLIFEDLDHPVKYVMRDEPTGVPALDRYCAPEEEKLEAAEWGTLLDLLEERNQILEVLQDGSFPVSELYAALFG